MERKWVILSFKSTDVVEKLILLIMMEWFYQTNLAKNNSVSTWRSYSQENNSQKSLLSHLNWHILERIDGEDNGNPLQYFCLENPMDGEAW